MPRRKKSTLQRSLPLTTSSDSEFSRLVSEGEETITALESEVRELKAPLGEGEPEPKKRRRRKKVEVEEVPQIPPELLGECLNIPMGVLARVQSDRKWLPTDEEKKSFGVLLNAVIQKYLPSFLSERQEEVALGLFLLIYMGGRYASKSASGKRSEKPDIPSENGAYPKEDAGGF